ncbi:MAG TPA: ABC transporter permease [Bacteroidia bacterium]|jgi:ABC-type Na+ efflux pump permease subunit
MFRIIAKDFKIFLTDRRAVMLTFFLPIMLISIFAMAFGKEKENNAQPINLLVCDEDHTNATADVITQLDSIKSLRVTMIPLDSGQRMVKTGNESALLVFHKGFKDSMDAGKKIPIELLYDQARAPEVGILQQALMSNLMRIIGTKTIMKREMERADKQFSNLDTSILRNIHKQIEAGFNQSAGDNTGGIGISMTPLIEDKQGNLGLIQAIAGTSVMMLMFGVMAMGASILDEKEKGTLKRLMYAPISTNSLLFGKMITSIMVGVFQLAVMLIYSKIMFGLDLMHNFPALILLVFATAFACSSLGVLLASVARSRQQVQMLSTLIVLSMSAIGGSMIPTFMMPPFMQTLSHLSVNYWSIQGFYDIYWRNLAFTDPDFLMRPLVLIAIGTALTFTSQFFYKRNVLKMT